MNKTLRKILYTFLLTLASFALLFVFSSRNTLINHKFHQAELLEETEQIFYDICWQIKFILQYRESNGNDTIQTLHYLEERIQLVDINEASFEDLGRYRTWPRTHHAKVVDALKKGGAAAIGFDILFKDADFGAQNTERTLKVLQEIDPQMNWDPYIEPMRRGFNHDSILIESVKNAGNVVAAAQVNPITSYDFAEYRTRLSSEKRRLETNPQSAKKVEDWEPSQFRSAILDNVFPELAQAANRIGLVNVSPDADGVHRRIPLFHVFPLKEHDPQATPHLYPILSLQLVLQLTGHSAEEMIIKPGEYVEIGKPFGVFKDSLGSIHTTFPNLTPNMLVSVFNKRKQILALSDTLPLLQIAPLIRAQKKNGKLSIDILDGQTLNPARTDLIFNTPKFDSLYFSINPNNPEIQLTDNYRLFWSEDENIALLEDIEDEEAIYFDHFTFSEIFSNKEAIFAVDSTAPLYLSSVLRMIYKDGKIVSDFIVLNESVLRDFFSYGDPQFANLAPGDTVRFGDPIRIPIDEQGQVLINYLGKYDTPNNQKTFRNISYSNLVLNKVEGIYQGKIFLLGSSATALFDMVSAPDEKNYPGVYIHMNLVENFLNNHFIRMLQPYWKWLLVLGFCLLASFISMFFNPFLAIMALIFTGLSYLVANFLIFQFYGIYYGVLVPESALALSYLLAMIVRYFLEEREKRQINSAFKQYISPELIDQMIASGSKPELGGQESVITAFFTDIASFSTFSEKIGSASKLVDLLNEYLSAMTEILSEHKGTLDKYIGDAIVAFFGAPAPLQNHARHSFDTAIAMQKRLEELRQKWTREGDKWPVIVHQMRMRIGINTGSIVTGNMGSKMRKNYTMMGDPVNLAARLESGAKQYGVYTLVSREALMAAGPENFLFRQIDKVKVVGKTLPVETFELLDHFEGAPQDLLELTMYFEEGRKLYLEMKWEEAITKFEKCIELEPHHPKRCPGSKTTPSHIYIERCKDYQKNPPIYTGEEWDGVFIATSK